MSNRTKNILVAVLVIVLIGLVYRSFLMLKSITPTKPKSQTTTAQTPATTAKVQAATPSQPQAPTIPSQPQPQSAPITNLSLALPPRNPFQPLIQEGKETPSTKPTFQPSPPKLPAPVITQLPTAQAPSQPAPTGNLILLGTVIGPQKLAIIKVGEKSFVVREGEKLDGLKIKKVERGKVFFEEGGEVELNPKGGEYR